MTDLATYQGMIATQHQKPKLLAVVAAICEASASTQSLWNTQWYDLESAVGHQLDVLGEWIGASRVVEVLLTGVYFALDTANVGFDEGTWKATGDPDAYAISLQDPEYRMLLKAKILNNRWDGSVEGAYALMNAAFTNFGYTIQIQDNGDLTMDLILKGPMTPSSLVWALFTNGYFDIKPAGVRVSNYSYVP